MNSKNPPKEGPTQTITDINIEEREATPEEIREEKLFRPLFVVEPEPNEVFADSLKSLCGSLDIKLLDLTLPPATEWERLVQIKSANKGADGASRRVGVSKVSEEVVEAVEREFTVMRQLSITLAENPTSAVLLSLPIHPAVLRALEDAGPIYAVVCWGVLGSPPEPACPYAAASLEAKYLQFGRYLEARKIPALHVTRHDMIFLQEQTHLRISDFFNTATYEDAN